jgi:hypothetical protein
MNINQILIGLALGLGLGTTARATLPETRDEAHTKLQDELTEYRARIAQYPATELRSETFWQKKRLWENCTLGVAYSAVVGIAESVPLSIGTMIGLALSPGHYGSYVRKEIEAANVSSSQNRRPTGLTGTDERSAKASLSGGLLSVAWDMMDRWRGAPAAVGANKTKFSYARLAYSGTQETWEFMVAGEASDCRNASRKLEALGQVAGRTVASQPLLK